MVFVVQLIGRRVGLDFQDFVHLLLSLMPLIDQPVHFGWADNNVACRAWLVLSGLRGDSSLNVVLRTSSKKFAVG